MSELDPIPPVTDRLEIALRAYVESAGRSSDDKSASHGRKKRSRAIARPSPWVLVFDTETTTDPGQSLRFGSYQVYEGAEQRETGVFYPPDGLSDHELTVLTDFAAANDLKVITRDDFVDRVFYGIGYDYRASIVGFNLPFDIARIALRHGSARGEMRGGFTFTLSADKRKPAVQVKHLNQKMSLIRFAAPFKQRRARSQRKRGQYVPVRRGHFVDVHTLASALFARSFNLDGLCDHLKVKNPKHTVEQHGVTLTPRYVEYAVRDTQATLECYLDLAERFERFGLTETPLPMAYSEASIGKGHLRAIGIRPWRELQPDFPSQMLANIMGGYFGGRSEVRIRRELRQVVLCDFLSMYPTTCTLMKLWRFVIAEKMTWRDGTAEVRDFLERVTVGDLLRPETWPRLTALVRVECERDIFPVRAKYSEEAQATIGLNCLSSRRPLWFTLADCIASKLLTGKTPRVVEAVVFGAGAPQNGLKPISIAGNTAFRVDPYKDHLYKRLIELRQSVKVERDASEGAEKERLEIDQNSLKIVANATSYEILVEVNVKELADKKSLLVHTSVEQPYQIESHKLEEPGRYFHPLLASMITGGARLMLAMTEWLATDQGLDWSFCDTDSMAIARPETMPEEELYRRVDAVVSAFATLNPYEFGGSILQVEKVNASLADKSVRAPLYCWAVSAKRYVLFNVGDNGEPILRKATAHGLGHLKAPYDETNPAVGIPAPLVKQKDLGVERWQHDLWWTIAKAALAGEPNRVDLGFHPALEQPAVSRYGATSPRLLDWFKPFNGEKPYAKQVKPFGFLYSLFAKSGLSTATSDNEQLVEDQATRRGRRPKHSIRPAAPYDKDLPRAVAAAFDRGTGRAVSPTSLNSYRSALAQYHMHPESKFLNGDYMDTGTTLRRHVQVEAVRNIGKEADHWEEQFFLGSEDEMQIDHALSPADEAARLAWLRERADEVGQRALARKLGISRSRLKKALDANTNGVSGL